MYNETVADTVFQAPTFSNIHIDESKPNKNVKKFSKPVQDLLDEIDKFCISDRAKEN